MPISLEEHPEMENNCENTSGSKTGKDFKATELRLGLPGCESPERDNGYSSLKGFVSGAKRGFADTINGGNGSGKWGLSVKVGSEIGFSKNGGLFSPRGVNVNISDCNTVNAVTESPKPSLQVQEKETPQVSAINGPAKAQVIGWPPIRSFRKNSMANNPSKSDETNGLYVKVSMDGAPYLRKIDLKTYNSYKDLSSALEKMFSCFTIGQVNENGIKDLICGSEFVLTYEDKDNDWMLVGDVPWEMFMNTCNRLRIMKSSDAIGLAPRVTEKCKSHN